MSDIAYFALAFALTLVLEGVVFAPLLVKGDFYFRLVFILINAVTNVALNLALGLLDRFTYDERAITITIVIGEILAVITEFFVLGTVCKNKYLFIFVLVANLVSAVAGACLLGAIFA